MKYYETSYDEYISSYEKYNLHPELDYIKKELPKNINDFKNIIIYGAPGVGKYTQTLSILHAYSPTKLKYDKKIYITYEKQEKKSKTSSIITSTSTSTSTSNTSTSTCTNISSDTTINTKKKNNVPTSTNSNSAKIQMKKQDKKQEYMYRISDIHYEIDMATLGCNSKLLWHDLFFQIIDIVSVSLKTNKIGIIVCKNFHNIHNELLEIFYSYMRHPLQHMNIQIKFIIITEHIGFIPDNIVNACEIISVKRPSKLQYLEMVKLQTKPFSCFLEVNRNGVFYDKTNRSAIFHKDKTADILEELPLTAIINSKEIHSFAWLKNINEIPNDVFNTICDALMEQIIHPETTKITDIRNNLYDLLIYNIDIFECVWYLFTSLIQNQYFKKPQDITDVLNKIFAFMKYYNNNYRSIYHLESIILCMLNKIHYN
jgi:hypothetical protein